MAVRNGQKSRRLRRGLGGLLPDTRRRHTPRSRSHNRLSSLGRLRFGTRCTGLEYTGLVWSRLWT